MNNPFKLRLRRASESSTSATASASGPVGQQPCAGWRNFHFWGLAVFRVQWFVNMLGLCQVQIVEILIIEVL
jgi:hypothetical protein